MRERQRKWQASSGFSLLQIIVLLCLLGVFFAVALPQYLQVPANSQQLAFESDRHELFESLQLVRAGYISGQTAGLPPDADNNGYPDHLGDVGDPAQLRQFFSAVMNFPITNARFEGEVKAPGWKSWNGWLPNDGKYYYCFDANGDDQCSSESDSRFYYDPATGTLVQDYFGAG